MNDLTRNICIRTFYFCSSSTDKLLQIIEAKDNTDVLAVPPMTRRGTPLRGGPCIEGALRCVHFISSDVVSVCNVHGWWQLFADCGKQQQKCVQQSPEVAQCTPKSNSQSGKTSTIARRGDAVPATPTFEYVSGPTEVSAESKIAWRCTPGTYTCYRASFGPEIRDNIYTCDSSGGWRFSAQCPFNQMCQLGPHGTAFCVALPSGESQKAVEDHTVLEPSKRAAEVDHSPVNAKTTVTTAGCSPGTYTCGYWPSGDSSIYTCDWSGVWRLSANCPRNQWCGMGPHGTAFCVAFASGEPQKATVEDHEDLKPSKRAVEVDHSPVNAKTTETTAVCSPGTYRCMNGLIQRCAQPLGLNWQNIVDCYPYKRCVQLPTVVYCIPIKSKTSDNAEVDQPENVFFNGLSEDVTTFTTLTKDAAATVRA